MSFMFFTCSRVMYMRSSSRSSTAPEPGHTARNEEGCSVLARYLTDRSLPLQLIPWTRQMC
jgi:hypothetical protein